MATQCPNCQSHETVRADPGRPNGGIAGSAAGLIAGAVQAASTFRISGPVLGMTGPVGAASVTLLGAAAGGLAGYIAGERIANNVRNLRSLRSRCLNCGHIF